MRLFGRFKKQQRPSRHDPLWGRLVFDRGTWVGELKWQDGSLVGISIEADHNGPDDRQRIAFQDFAIRYANLSARIGDALWALFEPMANSVADDFAPRALPGGPAEMLALTMLENIHLKHGGEIELLFVFVPEFGWEDAMFRVGLEADRVGPLSFDD